jgi:TatA/E family protein of Tat protein translocase
MFGPIGMPELIIIFVIALIVFGPRKLPELGKSLGKSLAEFRRASNDLRHTLEEEVRLEETRRDLEASLSEVTSDEPEPATSEPKPEETARPPSEATPAPSSTDNSPPAPEGSPAQNERSN